MSNVKFAEVKDAYIKLKSYTYYENFSIGLKSKLAEFEATHFELKLRKLTEDLNNYGRGVTITQIEKDISKISYYLTPKKFKAEPIDETNSFYFSNQNKKKRYEIDAINKVTPFIDCSIELHIVTILWILKIGQKLDRKLSRNCYGNRLVEKGPKATILNPELKLFTRYYLSYNKWRDAAIQAAKKQYRKDNDVAILNLDVQSYFNSIDLDLATLKTNKKTHWVNDILAKLHAQYSAILKNDGFISTNATALPIGLISSNILANYYLASLDSLIESKVKPVYYGRYVDDILIVFSNPTINKKSKTFVSDFIEQELSFSSKRQILGVKHHCSINREDDNNFNIIVNKNPLKFQLSKVKLYHLHKDESLGLLEGFEKQIRKNSSEFKFQLETSDLIESFEDSSYDIVYGDTVNKLRSVEKFNANKFGASKHLARLIIGTKDTSKIEKRKLEKVSNKIMSFFSGKRALELVGLWDKVFAFFVINNQPASLITFSKGLLKLLTALEFTDSNLTKDQRNNIEEKLVKGLLHQMTLSFAMAAALDISFFNAKVITSLKRYLSDDMDKLLKAISERNIKKLAHQLISSNLLRQGYLPLPLLNYCFQPRSHSFINGKITGRTSFRLSAQKLEYSPRFITYNEVEMFYYLQTTFFGRNVPKEYLKNRVDFVFKQYLAFNKSKAHVFQRRYFPKIEGVASPKIVSLNNEERLSKIKVGIVNIYVDDTLTFKSLKGNPVLTFDRLDLLHKVLNEAIRSKCKLIIFPEISVPFFWLSRLTEFSKRNDIGIICGVEHFKNKRDEAFNYVATILPFDTGHFTNAFLDLRLKIDYAPEEARILKENGFKVPINAKNETLRVYKWKGVMFSVLNCFELTDIDKRIKFKGEVDFLATVEYNKDIPYFSSINESLARDLHCYVIQVNTSNYGDSRITMPTDSVVRDFIKLKGGENISLVTGTLRIDHLRDFQERTLNNKKLPAYLQKKFKPLPPNFVMSKNRIKR
jgi:hypothetical protein